MEELTRRGFVKAAGVAVVAAGRLHAFQPATVVSDLAAPAVRFNRMLFGQFLEHFHRQVYGPETREWRLQGGAVQLPPHSVSIMQGLV